ncbi:MAG: DUF3617 domain-containing protein [Novosphingobium sp.]
MRALLMMPLFAGLALSACHSKPSVDAKNQSPEAVASQVAASGLLPRPGRWQADLKFVSIDMPGMPPAAREAMSKSMATTKSTFTCLTAARASKLDAGFFQKAAPGCTYDHYTMADGKIDALMTCPPGHGPTRMAMTGTYGNDAYNMSIKGSSEMAKGMAMNIAMEVTSRRVGECDGTEPK